LKDLDKANVLEPNNEFTLQCHVNVKRILKDYQRALKDLEKVDVFNPTMHSLCNVVEMSKGCWRTVKEP